MRIEVENFFMSKHYRSLSDLVLLYLNEIYKKDDLHRYADVDACLENLFKISMCKVAVFENQVLGFIFYIHNSFTTCLFIEEFYVHPSFYRFGVGKKILDSFYTDLNGGKFEILATIDEISKPEKMLGSFHDWKEISTLKEIRKKLIQGTWDCKKYSVVKMAEAV